MMNTDIKVLDQQDTILATLSLDDSSGSLPYFDDLVKEKRNDPYASFEFEAPADHEDAKYLQVENKIAIQNQDGQTILFRIKDTEERSSGELKTRWVFAESEALDLLNHWVRPQTLTGTAAEMLDTILYGSGWSPGTVEFTGDRTHIVDNYKTAIEVINEIRTLYASDLYYRVEITGSKITARYVDFLERLGTDTGRRFEFEKNMLEITRRESSQELATALIGIGESLDGGGFVTFENVVWSKAGGDPADKPAGQDWIGDPDALQKWGNNGRHVLRPFRDDEEDNPEILIAKTWEALQKRKRPAVTFEAKVATLERFAGFEKGESVRLGDTIRALDHSYNPPILLEARVNEYEWRLSEPTDDSVVLGDYVPRLSRQYAIIKDLQNTIQTNRGTWDAGTRIYSSPTAPANPEDGTFWQDTSTAAPHYIYSWNATAGAWIPTGATQASDLGAIDETGARTIAQGEAKSYVDANAEPAIHEGTTAPTDTTRKWLDTSTDPAILKAYINGVWVKSAPTSAEEVGADPAGSAATAEKNAKDASDPKGSAATAESNAKGYADSVSDTAEQNAKDYAEPEMHVGTTAPADTARKWLDITKEPYILKVYDTASQTWKKATPTTAGEVGADPSGSAATAESNAKNYAEPKIYKQTTAPAHSAGRLWLDTSVTPNVLKRSTGSAWVKVTPTTPGEVGADPAGAAATAESNAIKYAEKKIYRGATTPTGAVSGDLWIDESGTKPVYKKYNGTSWDAITSWDLSQFLGQVGTGQIKDNAVTTPKIDYIDAAIITVGSLTGITVDVTNAGMTAQDALATAVRIWAGATYTNRNSAPFRVQQDGKVITTNIDILGGNIAIDNDAEIGNWVVLNPRGTEELTGIKWMAYDLQMYLTELGYIGYDPATQQLLFSAGFGTVRFANPIEFGGNIEIDPGYMIRFGQAYFMYLPDAEGKELRLLKTLIVEGNSTFNSLATFNADATVNGIARFYGELSANSNTYLNGTTRNNGNLYNHGQIVNYNAEDISAVSEGGFCGVGGMTTGNTSITAGVGVNFRTKKNYTPSSVSLSSTGSNLVYSTHLATTDISANGFWLYIYGGSTTNTYRYWRGTYTA